MEKSKVVNLGFWKRMIADGEIQDFIEKGSDKQKKTIINVLRYLKKSDHDFFREVKGQTLIRKLKG